MRSIHDAPDETASATPRPPAEPTAEPWTVRVTIGFLDQSRTPVSKTLKHAMQVIECHARDRCFAFPSIMTLSRKCGCKPRRMQIILKALTELNWIKVIPAGPAKRSGRIILLLRRINQHIRLPVFDPLNGSESEDQIRALVRCAKGIAEPSEQIPEQTPENHTGKTPSNRNPETPTKQGVRKRQLRTFVRNPIAHFPAPLIKTKSSDKKDEPTKTTTTNGACLNIGGGTPKKTYENNSSSSFFDPSSQTPKTSKQTTFEPGVDQTELDALVARFVALAAFVANLGLMAAWDDAEARRRIKFWLDAGHSLTKIRNTLADGERPRAASKVIRDLGAWMSGMLGATGPNGPVPPEKPRAAKPETKYYTASREKSKPTPVPSGFASWSEWRVAGCPDPEVADPVDRAE